MRICTKCAGTLPLDHFYKKLSGLQPICKACTKEANARYHAENREALREKAKLRYQKNRARRIEQAQAWNRTHRADRSRIMSRQNAKRRARARGNGGRGFTAVDWQRALDHFGHRCAYCGVDGQMTMDHVVPISRGGAHDPANIVPTCPACNYSKGSKLLAEWRPNAAARLGWIVLRCTPDMLNHPETIELVKATLRA